MIGINISARAKLPKKYEDSGVPSCKGKSDQVRLGLTSQAFAEPPKNIAARLRARGKAHFVRGELCSPETHGFWRSAFAQHRTVRGFGLPVFFTPLDNLSNGASGETPSPAQILASLELYGASINDSKVRISNTCPVLKSEGFVVFGVSPTPFCCIGIIEIPIQ